MLLGDDHIRGLLIVDSNLTVAPKLIECLQRKLLSWRVVASWLDAKSSSGNAAYCFIRDNNMVHLDPKYSTPMEPVCNPA